MPSHSHKFCGEFASLSSPLCVHGGVESRQLKKDFEVVCTLQKSEEYSISYSNEVVYQRSELHLCKDGA